MFAERAGSVYVGGAVEESAIVEERQYASPVCVKEIYFLDSHPNLRTKGSSESQSQMPTKNP